MVRVSIYISMLCFASLLVGMRSLVSGFDTEAYISILNAAKLLIDQGASFSEFFIKYAYVHPEPLYSFFVYILAYFNCSPRVYLLVVSFLTFFCFGIAINTIDRRNNVEILLLVLCSMTFVFLFSNAMRQGIALGIVFFAFSKLFECNYKKFGFLIFLASLFHTSALALIFVPFFLRTGIKVQLSIFLFTAVISSVIGLDLLLKLINIPIVTDKFLYYSQDGRAGGWSFYSALFLPIISFCLFSLSNSRHFSILFSIYLYLCILCLLFSFSSTMFDRLSAYRFLFEPIIFMALCMMFKQKVVVKYMCLFFSLFYFLFVVFPSEAVHKTLFY